MLLCILPQGNDFSDEGFLLMTLDPVCASLLHMKWNNTTPVSANCPAAFFTLIRMGIFYLLFKRWAFFSKAFLVLSHVKLEVC